jgi:hypothetical protein
MRSHALCTFAAVAGLAGCTEPVADSSSDTNAGLTAYEAVAQRIYTSERGGPPVRASLRRIAKDAAAMRGDRPAMLEQLFTPGYHVVRLEVKRRGRVVNDVGGRFVVAGPTRRGMTISIQDVIGYVKLVHRLTGVGVVVRGKPGHVAASSKPLLAASLPDAGTATVGGRIYAVASFTEPGFAGEPLRVWLLDSDPA